MIKIKKIKPMFTAILTTMDTYEDDVTCNSIIVKTKGTIKEYQKVVAVGDTVRSVKVGDLVCINPKFIPNVTSEDSFSLLLYFTIEK